MHPNSNQDIRGKEPSETRFRKITVSAETHDDDRLFETPFDASAWFAAASDAEILALAACEWGRDYAADAVALWFDGRHAEITAMFSFKRSGFECTVDRSDALAWIQQHRPYLLDRIQDFES